MAEVHVHAGESQVEAVVGDTVVVQLVEPGATGYQWVTEIEGDAVVEAFSTVQVPEGVAPGQAATRTVGFTAVREGLADVVSSSGGSGRSATPSSGCSSPCSSAA